MRPIDALYAAAMLLQLQLALRSVAIILGLGHRLDLKVVQ